MSGFLNLPLYHNHTGLRVDGAKCLLIGGTAALAEQVGEHVAVVAHEECMRHIGQLLRVLLCQVQGRSDRVGDDVIHVACTAGTRVTQPHDLREGGEEGGREGGRGGRGGRE